MTSTRDECGDTTTTSTEERAQQGEISYHRRAAVVCCIIPGEMDDGGLAMRMPVEGLTIGMALVRERSADGWWIFSELLLLVNVGGETTYADVAAEEMDSKGVIC